MLTVMFTIVTKKIKINRNKWNDNFLLNYEAFNFKNTICIRFQFIYYIEQLDIKSTTWVSIKLDVENA